MQSWWGAELIEQRRPEEIWARAKGLVTIERLRAETGRMVGLFRAHGVRGGDTVALHGVPSFTQLWSVFALWSIGVQVIYFEPTLAVPDRRTLLEMCTPQFLVTFGGAGRTFTDECSVLVRRLPGGRPARTSHCVVQFSSGTTGRPKMVGRTSESLLTELDRWRLVAGMPTAGEQVALLESTARSFGLIGGLLYALDVGATVLFPPADLAPAQVVLGAPRHFEQLLGADLPELRLAVSSGDMLPLPTYSAFLARFGVRIGQAYGTTETGVVTANLDGALGPPPTIGRAVPGVRTRVVDSVLEVHVPHSPYLTQVEPWPGGWMSTHDLVAVEPGSGAMRLHGRAASLDLARIESTLRAHRDVTEAVVFDEECIEAHVSATKDVDPGELEDWCLRLLGEQRTPSSYHVVRELPRTANGKLLRDRHALREYGAA